MSSEIEFETPENVRLNYQPAGLGSRFLAYFADRLLFGLLVVLLSLLLLFVWTASIPLQRWFESQFPGGLDSEGGSALYVIGLIILVAGLGSFVYFAAFEYLMGGQTPGKRSAGIRVVKADGFALDAGSIILRSLFRIIDDIPILWIVPIVTKNSQRLGDLVAGTVVVKDQPAELSDVRARIAQAPMAERQFRFDVSMLKRARPEDFHAIERILERWDELPEDQGRKLLETICEPLARRMQTQPPSAEQRLIFLKELLAAEYRRQQRKLG